MSHERKGPEGGNQTGRVHGARTASTTTASGGRSPGKRTLTENLPSRRVGLPEVEVTPGAPASPEEFWRDLETQAINNVQTTQLNFARACEQVKEALHARAKSKDSDWFLDLLVDVIAGTLLPGLAKGALGRAVDLFTAGAKHEETVELGLFLIENDQVGALIGELTGSVNGAIKSAFHETAKNLPPAFEFVNQLGDHVMIGLNQVANNLTSAPREQVMAAHLAYSPAINTSAILRERILDLALKFETQIAPIGEKESDTEGTPFLFNEEKLLVVIVDDGKEHFAVVEKKSSTLITTGEEMDGAQYHFIEWISDDMKEIAVNKADEVGQSSYPRIPIEKVWAPGTKKRFRW